jgi:hypothetical protein
MSFHLVSQNVRNFQIKAGTCSVSIPLQIRFVSNWTLLFRSRELLLNLILWTSCYYLFLSVHSCDFNKCWLSCKETRRMEKCAPNAVYCISNCIFITRPELSWQSEYVVRSYPSPSSISQTSNRILATICVESLYLGVVERVNLACTGPHEYYVELHFKFVKIMR